MKIQIKSQINLIYEKGGRGKSRKPKDKCKWKILSFADELAEPKKIRDDNDGNHPNGDDNCTKYDSDEFYHKAHPHSKLWTSYGRMDVTNQKEGT